MNIPVNAPQPVDDVHQLVRTTIADKLEALDEVTGFPVISYFLDEGAALADEQMYHLYEHLRRIEHQERLGLWLSSRGGATELPVKIVSLMREFTERFVVLVPYRAHSAATQIALGADEIVMTPMAELGPVDPSRRHPLLPKEEGTSTPIPISVQDLRHVLQFVEREFGGKEKLTPEAAATIYTALFEKVHPLAIGALEQSWALSQQVCEQVLSTHMDPKKEANEIKAIVDRLSDHYKSHLYQIDRPEAKEIGLKIRDATDDERDAMWTLLLAYMGIQLSGEGELNRETCLGHPPRSHRLSRRIHSRAWNRQEERSGKRADQSVGVEVVGGRSGCSGSCTGGASSFRAGGASADPDRVKSNIPETVDECSRSRYDGTTRPSPAETVTSPCGL